MSHEHVIVLNSDSDEEVEQAEIGVGGNDEFDNAFLATNGGARVGRSATTTTAAAGGGDAVGAGGFGFGGDGSNVFGMMMQAQRNLQSDQQSSKRKMQINTHHQQHKQQRQYAVGQKKAPMKKNVGSSSSLPVSRGGDSQTARATTPRMTPTGSTMMLTFQRSYFERFSEDQMMMNSPTPPTTTAYAGGYAFDAGEDVLVFDAEALAALASEEEKNKSQLLQKAKTMNEKMKHCGKRDILLEEDSKIVIDLEGASDVLGEEEYLGAEPEVIDLTIEEDRQITAEMNELRIESSNQDETSLPNPVAEREDAVDVLTAACEKLPMQFTERVTNLLDEECPGTKPFFRLKDNSCASTIFRYDLNDRGKDAVLEQATPEVLERIKSECRAGTAGVQKSVHLAFAPLVPEGGSQYRNYPGGRLLKSPTARGLEALHKKFWEVYDFKCSPETKFLYVVTGNVWMEASYVRIRENAQEGDRIPAKVHERFNAEGDENFGNLPPSLWVLCFAKIYAILAEITTSVRVKGGENLKNFIFAIDTAKGAKALFNAAKSFFNVSDAYFLALFPVYGTGVHPSLIVRKWCLWLYAARLLAMCAYYRTGEILGGQTIPHASSYPEPGRGRVQVPPPQPRQQQQQRPKQWPIQPMQMHMPGEPQQNRQQHAISGFYGSHESGIIMRKNGRMYPKNNPILQVKATQRYNSYVSNTGGETPAWLKASHDKKRAQGRDHVSNVAQRKAMRDKGDPKNPRTPVNLMCAHVNTDGKRCSYVFEEGTNFSLTTSLTSFSISHPAKGSNSNGKKCRYTINLSSEDSRKTLVSIAMKNVAYEDKLTLLDQLFGRVTSRELPRATQNGKPFTDEQMKVKQKKHGTDLKEIKTAIQEIKKKLEEKENKKMHASFE
ncbi:unnamed protein product [Bathycoccus prasinos]